MFSPVCDSLFSHNFFSMIALHYFAIIERKSAVSGTMSGPALIVICMDNTSISGHTRENSRLVSFGTNLELLMAIAT